MKNKHLNLKLISYLLYCIPIYYSLLFFYTHLFIIIYNGFTYEIHS